MIHLLKRIAWFVPRLWSLLGIALLMVIAIEILASTWLRVTHRSENGEDYRVHADGYHDAEWVHPYFHEFEAANHAVWRSYVYWRRAPFRGRYLNIDEQGLRRTWNPPTTGGEKRPRIFIFGGSTMWGTGARDDYTIASWLSRLLMERTGVAATVVNFGEGGYLSTQELIALEEELQRGSTPDVAVFLDGVNDVFAAFQNGVPGIPQNEANRMREFNIDQRIYREALLTWFKESAVFALLARPGVAAATPQVDLDALSAKVTEHYAAFVTMIDRLARTYHFQALFFWQPVIFAKQQLTPYEHDEATKQAFLKPFYQNVYERVRDRRAWEGRVRYVGDLFAADAGPYFIDFCHLTESGNQRIAQTIVSDVAAALAAPAP